MAAAVAATHGDEIRSLFRDALRGTPGTLSCGEVRRLLERCAVEGQLAPTEADIRLLFDAIDDSNNGVVACEEFLNFVLSSPQAVASATDVAAEQLRSTMKSGKHEHATTVAILGAKELRCQDSEELIKLVAGELCDVLPPGSIVFVTGGLSGVQQCFSSAVAANPRGWLHRQFHLVPRGQSSGYSQGKDLAAGEDETAKGRLLGRVGDVYLTFEGGPGVSGEAAEAFQRGALIVPLIRTGGASSGMFDFPQGAMGPQGAAKDPEPWRTLADTKATLGATAAAVAKIVAAHVQGVPRRVRRPSGCPPL